MEKFLQDPVKKYKFLVCSNIDGPSSGRIAEKFVPINHKFDLCILIGPFAHDKIDNIENNAIINGDISSMIAQFENIVCRVIYLPIESDPLNILTEQIHLTPNSLNIHGRFLNLTSNLSIMGLSEKGENITHGKIDSSVDRSVESDDELDHIDIIKGESIKIMNEMINNCIELCNNSSNSNSSYISDGDGKQKGSDNKGMKLKMSGENTIDNNMMSNIFILNYHYSHTLNHFLFHMTSQLEEANIHLAIITSVQATSSQSTTNSNQPLIPITNELDRLPSKFGNLNILVPKSLRRHGYYSIVDIAYDDLKMSWSNIQIQTLCLD